jgi:hypothetical protein
MVTYLTGTHVTLLNRFDTINSPIVFKKPHSTLIANIDGFIRYVPNITPHLPQVSPMSFGDRQLAALFFENMRDAQTAIAELKYYAECPNNKFLT